MELHLETTENAYFIQHYTANSITVNGRMYTSNLLVMPDYLSKLDIKSFEAVREEHFTFLLERTPEVFLLGTGVKIHFPAPELLIPLINHQIGVETMTTPAACRTYNVLMAEGRKVAALLFLG